MGTEEGAAGGPLAAGWGDSGRLFLGGCLSQGWQGLEQASLLSPRTLPHHQKCQPALGTLWLQLTPHFPRQAAQARMWMRTVNRHSLNIYPHFLWAVSPIPKTGSIQVNPNE